MDVSVLVTNKNLLKQFFVDTGYSLEDLSEMMDDRDGWKESQGNPC